MRRKSNNTQLSIEVSRKALRAELKKKCKKGEAFTQVIHFTNDDVPNYLKWLKQVEEESRKTTIMVS